MKQFFRSTNSGFSLAFLMDKKGADCTIWC